ADLDLDVGMRDQVLVPSRIFRRATLRGDDDEPVAVPTIDERELPRASGLPAGRMQDEAVRAVPVVAYLAAGCLVLPNVLVAEEAVVWHAAYVPRARRRRDPPPDGSSPTATPSTRARRPCARRPRP